MQIKILYILKIIKNYDDVQHDRRMLAIEILCIPPLLLTAFTAWDLYEKMLEYVALLASNKRMLLAFYIWAITLWFVLVKYLHKSYYVLYQKLMRQKYIFIIFQKKKTYTSETMRGTCCLFSCLVCKTGVTE